METSYIASFYSSTSSFDRLFPSIPSSFSYGAGMGMPMGMPMMGLPMMGMPMMGVPMMGMPMMNMPMMPGRRLKRHVKHVSERLHAHPVGPLQFLIRAT